MNKDKQIEEMVKDLAPIMSSYGQFWRTEYLASDLVKLGYRKQSDWISVDSEHKPRHLQSCFIAYVYGDSDMIFYGEARYHAFEGNGIVDRPHFSNEGVEGMTVKYWMAIPKLPKMKGGAE